MDLGEMLGIKQVRMLLLEIICFLTCKFTFSFHLLEEFQGMNIHWNLFTNFIS